MAKRVLLPSELINFSPASAGSGILDFQMIPNFDPRKVLAIINTSYQQQLIYAVASYAQNLGGIWSGTTTLILQTDTSLMSPSDLLQIIYDDGENGIFDANNQPIYSTPDPFSIRNGLDVNLLNGSVIGQIDQPLDEPYGDTAMAVAFNQGGTLKSPHMDPVTNDLFTKVVSDSSNPVYVNVVGGGGTSSVTQGSAPWLTQLVDGTNTALQTNLGTYDAQTLRVVLATGQTYPVSGTLNLATGPVTDINGVTYTTSGNTGGITSTTHSSYSFQLWVGTVTGTSPTMDFKIQQSFDNSLWTDLYHFPRITGSSQWFITPNLRVTGTWIRYVRTITGTSPSFAGTTVTRITRSGIDASDIKNFFDRTINLNSLNSVTGSYFVGGCDTIEMTVCNGSGGTGTNPNITLEFSDDNLNWVTMTANGTISGLAPSSCGLVSLSSYQPKFVRAKVTTAGTSGHNATYVCLKGYGA